LAGAERDPRRPQAGLEDNFGNPIYIIDQNEA
jgi:hypothetical protein